MQHKIIPPFPRKIIRKPPRGVTNFPHFGWKKGGRKISEEKRERRVSVTDLLIQSAARQLRSWTRKKREISLICMGCQRFFPISKIEQFFTLRKTHESGKSTDPRVTGRQQHF